MIDLNELCKVTLANAEKRKANGAAINPKDTEEMLKHCAMEVVEAVIAYTRNYENTNEDAVDEFYHEYISELADIICCVLIIAGKENIDIEQAILDCIEKNRKRAEKIGDKL